MAWTERPATRAVDVATQLGATDVLVLRRVTDESWAHLGGSGLGEDWVGMIEVDASTEPLIAAALRGRTVVRRSSDRPMRMVGPYYAQQCAVLRVDGDFVLVLGRSDHTVRLAPVPDAELRVRAATLVNTLPVVSPAKRLADEMEVLRAMQAIYQVTPASYAETLRSVTDIVTGALNCDLGIAVTASGGFAACASGSPFPPGWTDEGARAAVATVLDRTSLGKTLCVQDAGRDPMPAPLGPADGVCSYFAVPLPEPIGGGFVVCHTDRLPRGFTALGKQLGQQLAMAAASIVHAAELREQLQAEVETAQQAAFVDPLTGVGNRRAWEVALADAQVRVERGRGASVIVLDLNGLKEANDHHGHAAGDEVLRRFAGAVQRAVRTDDVVCRIGGDELFVLLVGADTATCRDVVARIRTALLDESSRGPIPVSAAIGWATTEIDGSLSDAVVAADGRMYADKRRQRAGRGVARTG
ncbi:MAG: diguanylate cyclase [Actinomycetia bacterium]|nr:diguanylate cyclase [Actinomycetes bacterium]MDQ1651260.1 diguanylate cyclase [Cryptosporangiaceae bacterium]MDQ1657708.1 diguanylate cyclase [Cryptosporangiaceae bacterium]